MIVIADSGSTKTDWCVVNGQDVKWFTTKGINPYHLDEHQIINILKNEFCHQLMEYAKSIGVKDVFDDIREIFFYGAGCTPEKSHIVATALRKTLNNNARLFVKSDMLGAAKGICADNPGVVCILGTGSNSCYYDGTDIVDNVPPLGFILGDEGSGAYIGKRLVGNCIKKQFPEDICSLFLTESNLTLQAIIQKVYRENMPNRFLAELSMFCARHKDIKVIHDFLVDCFVQFFMRNVNLYHCPEIPVFFVGSIAWFYREELAIAAEMTGFKIGNVIRSPLTGLLEYHAGINNY